ncbi:MAG: SDR family oxidoreductase [Anaerolineales bacterium]|nr:SDR family oxidoreductase [Anaerolineales bacterium]
MENKICMITGATAGIGLETARALAKMGARLALVGRDAEKCAGAAARIRQESGNPAVDCLLADLSSQAQIRALALQFRESYPALHVLVNNAGGFFLRRQATVDGLEMTFALNHLSYFMLTLSLIDVLKSSAPARIVNVASAAHHGQRLDFDNLQIERGFYHPMRVYGRSKLANILFTFELARRLEGSRVAANALHPGFVATNFAKNNGPLARLALPLLQRKALTPEQGAQTSIYLASSDEVEGVSGEYFGKCKRYRAAPAAYDEGVALRLWEVSEELTGVKWIEHAC